PGPPPFKNTLPHISSYSILGRIKFHSILLTDLHDKLGDPSLGQDEITNVFSINPLSMNDVISNNINTAFFGIQKTYPEQIRRFWELTSLKQYLQQKLVPKVLRPDILLPDKIQTEEQLSEWNTILLNCTFRLMDFL
ncbi:Hypothetical predicted protein, partial [Pelobates cultripes]